jgi:hypothetical protein
MKKPMKQRKAATPKRAPRAITKIGLLESGDESEVMLGVELEFMTTG